MMPARLTTRISSLLLGAGGLFSLLALMSYHPADLTLLSSEPNAPLRNIGGVVGSWVAMLGRGGFGWASLVVPLLALMWAVQGWRREAADTRWTTRILATLCLLAALGALAALPSADPGREVLWGGTVGYLLVRAGRYYLGITGTALVAGCVAALAWVLIADQTTFSHRVGRLLKALGQAVAKLRAGGREDGQPGLAGAAAGAGIVSQRAASAAASQIGGASFHARTTVAPADEAALEPPRPRIRSTVVTQKPKTIPSPSRVRPSPLGFQLPSLDLLTTPPPISERQLGEDLHVNAKVLEDTLRDFGIEAHCVNIDRGPVVTRYELQPAPGVKLTKIVSLADDLALVMKAASCHIVAPIPGKGLVGVEVPNSTAAVVYVKEVLTAREFQQLNSPLALAIGMDVAGHPVICDLRECPHLLVAGATGSGKTVCLNALMTGFLCLASPDEVKFLMIDPKMVELVLFNDIPHLVAPVVTDAKRAAAALHWAVREMERRYQLLAKSGTRNIDAYNKKVQSGQASEADAERMPYLVVVVDELADLMMVAAQDVEGAITRLSQLSRAVGIHIILATQRPSVDVITGVIKANFPSRIAFQVPSKVDSRTILDANGADKLLGRGDLMFLRPGTAKPVRAQGCFVTDGEIERIVSHVKSQRPPAYDDQLMAHQEKPAGMLLDDEKDELYEMAKKVVLESRQASTSLLQRRLRLGYARAARILDLMEQEGLVGPPQGSRPREILVEPSATGSME